MPQTRGDIEEYTDKREQRKLPTAVFLTFYCPKPNSGQKIKKGTPIPFHPILTNSLFSTSDSLSYSMGCDKR